MIDGWKAWYADGQLYSSAGVPWRSTPVGGLVLVVLYYRARATAGARYRTFLMGDEWYFDDPEWLVASSTASREEILAAHPGAILRAGTLMEDEAYAALVARAMADREWP